MECVHCGTKLPEDAIFCSSCGAIVNPDYFGFADNATRMAWMVDELATEDFDEPASIEEPASEKGAEGEAPESEAPDDVAPATEDEAPEDDAARNDGVVPRDGVTPGDDVAPATEDDGEALDDVAPATEDDGEALDGVTPATENGISEAEPKAAFAQAQPAPEKSDFVDIEASDSASGWDEQTGYFAIDPESVQDIPVVHTEEGGQTVLVYGWPEQPKLGIGLTICVAVISVSVAIILIAVIGWVVLPALFATVA